eukprot:m.58346 g.58346  ORF g.58346 m.58346 type:complete len:59 (+) comp13758_c0_seq2:233-409(+)
MTSGDNSWYVEKEDMVPHTSSCVGIKSSFESLKPALFETCYNSLIIGVFWGEVLCCQV